MIYQLHLKILDFNYRFLKIRRRKNKLVKKPRSSGGLGINRGYILLTTLLMISIITILVLSLMQCIYWELKISNQLIENHEALYQLEAAANILAKRTHDSSCIIHEKNPTRISVLMLKNDGCKMTFHSDHHNPLGKGLDQNNTIKKYSEKDEYYYLISDLREDQCLVIMLDEKQHASHQWLINITNKRFSNYFLQLRISTVGEIANCGLLKPHKIIEGVMSWRIVSSG